ncbi:MAG TPA: NAD(P)H-binding protein [Streptomyces sp.]|uniref:NAD(P)H-binding protein n=1 Tax=Streptomyces sp. TaxID=1931 RepID=UPI002D619B74|nr:NAD(P)H-binding protein [Streptomyces sp.]HZG04302.1 NAD(P)H-binding protein [Streptomyces sp.]
MIVVTGATGNVGRALVGRLVAEGQSVRAVSRRDAEHAALPSGVEVTRLESADLFEGASKLFLHVQATGDRTGTVLDRARAAGVRHVVMLSSGIIQEGADETHPVHVMHARAEQLVRDSGLEWTFLRPNAFSTNALQWAGQIREGDTVRGPFADAVTAPIHEDDIAAVAERSLLDAGHHGAVHRLTGPEAVTNAGQVATIGRALGRDLTYVEVPIEEVEADFFPDMPRQAVRAVLKSFAALVGSQPEITSAVEEVTGRPARTFAQWAEDHKADFVR